MTSLYNLEPQPTAKVILQTTAGDIALELFGKQAPLATRNFLQHCLDGYYNNTIFHRLVPGFIIQGGDPSGSGSGGISAINDGEPFEDEFHSRLKFNRRGLLGMANEGKDSNGSQFFITLGSTPELQGKHTMFGRIEGDTIYNLMKMAEVEMTEEGSERPMYPTKVTGSEILVNPFEGMEARVKDAPRTTSNDKGKKDVKKRKKPLGKNVLSFGGDEGEEDAAPVMKKAKANPKFVSTTVETREEINNTPLPGPSESRKKVEKRRKSPSPVEKSEVQKPAAPAPAPAPAQPEDEDEDDEDEQSAQTKSLSALEKTNAEIAALKASMKRTVDHAPKEREKPKSALEAMIPATSTRGRKRGKMTDEKGALDLFKAFKQKLEDLPSAEPPASTTNDEKPEVTTNGASENPESTTADAEDDEAALCDLHFIANCQSCRAWDDEKLDGDAEADGDDDPAWMAHQLTFAKDTLGKDLEWKKKMSEIEVIDPREKAREIEQSKKEGKGKARSKR